MNYKDLRHVKWLLINLRVAVKLSVSLTNCPNYCKIWYTSINNAILINSILADVLTFPLLTSKTPKRYKRNTINGDLHRSKRIP